MKKILATGVVILFILVAFVPSLYADVETINEKNELVELTVEFYGLDKTNSHEVTVTGEDSEKLDVLFDEVRNELKNATTDSERISIFNDCIIELDRFGLLGNDSIEDVKRITTELYKEKLYNNSETAYINYNCLIIGKTNFTNFFYSKPILDEIISNAVKFINLIKNEILHAIVGLSTGIIFTILYLLDLRIMHTDSTIAYGKRTDFYDEPNRIYSAGGWVWTLGESGILEFDGGFGRLGTITHTYWIWPKTGWIYYYIGARNFKGIRLIGFYGDRYLGFASEVSIG